ncbi:hypothetical protein DPMN_086928 [Dreissena polymorpha]|uniref:G-protein coupled receptors family 1 profile domain-containing protein n=1 Tax=Dreissena polymorpha TaxID=45954 RepID=A0A9D4KS27_DREPO|nr:hypothetical protein DPMN_086928 [Dreissena polymorpha]
MWWHHSLPRFKACPIRTLQKNCLPIAQYAHLLQLLFYVDLTLTLLLPFVLLIILLAFMMVATVRSIQRKQQQNNRKNNEEYHTSRIRKLPQVRVAKMLYILSISVVFLNIPSHGFKLKSLIFGNAILSETESLIHLLLLFISYTSFSVKFLFASLVVRTSGN